MRTDLPPERDAHLRRGLVPNVVDERLAWLAIRDELRAEAGRSRGMGFMRVVRGLNGGSPSAVATAEGIRSDIVDRKMTKFAIAADSLVDRFSHEERFMLRAAGQVPAWYVPAVKRQARKTRR